MSLKKSMIELHFLAEGVKMIPDNYLYVKQVIVSKESSKQKAESGARHTKATPKHEAL